MASCHISVKIISRAKGKSGVAAAAYRSCSKIMDERLGMEFDYSQKRDLVYSDILAPDNASKWMLNRAELWNHIELIETRKNSQISREIELALPKELTVDQNIDLVTDYVKSNFVSMGMIADINIHNKDNNPHAHVMLTMRRIKGNGFGSKKEARGWNKRSLVPKWREAWAYTHNKHMAQAGFDIRIDHRSYAEQGIRILPQIKLGVGAYKDQEFDRIQTYKNIAFQNGQQIIADPRTALDHITRMQSTFTYEDILKYVHSHSDESQFHAAVQAVSACEDLVLIQKNQYERFNRYTTKSLLRTEQSMYTQAVEMAGRKSHQVEEKYIRQALYGRTLSREQEEVLRQTVQGNDLHVIIGHAGTGKSYTLAPIREIYEAQGYNVQGVALAGVAARGLERTSGIASTTIHEKLRRWQNGIEKPDAKTLIVIDEAGMVGTRHMEQLIAQANAAGAKAIPVGDLKQTPAPEAGGAFRAMVQVAPTSRLSEIWRQKVDWQVEATLLFSGEEARIGHALDAYHSHGKIHEHDDFNAASASMIDDYVANYSEQSSSLMMALTNNEVDRLNQLCRHKLRQDTKFLGSREYEFITSNGSKTFAAGDRILFLKNERSLGLNNGSFGTVQQAKRDGVLVVELDDGPTVAIDSKHYEYFTHGYAATVHKLQGATVDRAYVIASDRIDRHLGYVAMSRHQHDVDLYWSRDRFQNYEHLKRSFSNLAEKELLADFDQSQTVVEDALEKITATDATFNEKTLTAAAEALELEHGQYAKATYMENIKAVGQDRAGNMRYSTREMIAAEKRLFDAVQNMGRSKDHELPRGLVDALIGDRPLGDNQKFVVRSLVAGTDLSMVSHQHGTDRGAVARLVAEVYQKQGYVVEAIALSNMGAENFKNCSGIETSTVVKKLWQWKNGRDLLNDRTLLFVDNANLIGTRQSEQLIAHAQEAGAKVVFLSNNQMLQAIEAGGAQRGMMERTPGTKVVLQRDENKAQAWQQRAVDLLHGDMHSAYKSLALYAEHGCIEKAANASEAVVDDWLNHVQQSGSYRDNMMMTYRNVDAMELNLLAREKLRNLGYISSTEYDFKTFEGDDVVFAAGDRVMFTRQDEDLGVTSGSLGTLRQIEGDKLTVKLDAGPTIQVDTKLYNDLRHGYAVTVHKGSALAVDNTFIMATQHFNKHATLAALQCHKKSVKIYHGFEKYNDCCKYLCRPGTKELTVDYPMEKQAYKISIKMEGFGWKSKTVEVSPQIDKENTKAQLTRQARAFLLQEARRARLSPEQIKDTITKIEQVPMDQHLAHEKLKAKGVKKGRGPEIG